MANYFNRPKVISSPPTTRAAYSDRTAWIMAELCRLVYEPLPAERSVEHLLGDIRQAVREGADDSTLSGLLRRARAAGVEADTDIEAELKNAGLQLLDAFAEGSTEGMVIKLAPTRTSSGMLVVVFRGTEKCYADIKTDLKANLVQARDGGRVHAGFMEAFQRVEARLRKAIGGQHKLPVYFTGHSLGGALALIAARYVGSDSTGATYTFGCPRVADDGFYRNMKIPVYRVVNGADGVARIPFGYGLTILLSGLRFIPINGTLRVSEWIRQHFVGYTHFGSLVFLRPTVPDLDTALIVRKSPNIFWLGKTVVTRWVATRARALVSDHAIDQYAHKLGQYAEWRNRKPS